MTRIGIIGLGHVGLPLAAITASGNLRSSTTPEGLRVRDAVVIATRHRTVDSARVVANPQLVVDLRNALRQTLNGSPNGAVPANVDVL